MTPFLEWTGYVPAAVSAVHALGALVRVWRQKSAGREAARSHAGLAAEGRQEDPVERDPAAPADAPCTDVVVRIDLTVRVVGGDAAADAERGAW
ncbi:hypothetical protein ACIHJG_22415 [Streptomyces sp. NPDC052415]|uniref:hypothetical protein n=1 Tax=Streptomyces sp. NPDC052415 TaxID=3365690 RepID=UPI0037CF6E68